MFQFPSAPAGTRRNGSGGNAANGSRGRVINSLTIRGADQVSLRVTVAEIWREIVKQLGVNMSGGGPNGSFTLENPFAINGAVATSEGMLNRIKGGQNFSATLQAFERQGRLSYARRAHGHRGFGRKRQIPRRRHNSYPQ